MKLSVIIPAYNEEKTILEVIGNVKKTRLKGIRKEIIIIDDFSKDNTKKILEKLKDRSLKIFFHKKNLGKGASIRTALKHATGDVLLIQDADMEYSPGEYQKLLMPILEGKAKVVYGSRLGAIRKDLKHMYKLHYIGNIILTLTTNLLYGANITDMETCYKVFRREVIRGMRLRSRRFDFEPEITAKILKRGYKITEIPIGFVGRSFDEGKKITWRDGIKALFCLVKYRVMD